MQEGKQTSDEPVVARIYSRTILTVGESGLAHKLKREELLPSQKGHKYLANYSGHL